MGPVVELLGKRRGQMFDMQGVGCVLTFFFFYSIFPLAFNFYREQFEVQSSVAFMELEMHM